MRGDSAVALSSERGDKSRRKKRLQQLPERKSGPDGSHRRLTAVVYAGPQSGDVEAPRLGEYFRQHGLIETAAAIRMRASLHRKAGDSILLILALDLPTGGARIFMDNQSDGADARVCA